VTEELVAQFRKTGECRRPNDSSAEVTRQFGVRWRALRAFAKSLGVIDMNVLSKNLYTGTGVGNEGINGLGLSDGVYIVAGWTIAAVGHVFVGEVCWGRSDVNFYEGRTIQDPNWLESWLHSISYV